jgi:hypothetical protein
MITNLLGKGVGVIIYHIVKYETGSTSVLMMEAEPVSETLCHYFYK